MRWSEDLRLVHDMGILFCAMVLLQHFLPMVNSYWEFYQISTFRELIAATSRYRGLCHFGVPIGSASFRTRFRAIRRIG
jgi:hypothetical protein